jgi:hypothetical protein
MKETFKEIFLGFKNSPLATLCVLLVAGFAFIYNDLRDINAEQRQFMNKLHDSQVLMNENLTALNLRMTNIESNFKTTPEQLKELILLLHRQDIEDKVGK